MESPEWKHRASWFHWTEDWSLSRGGNSLNVDAIEQNERPVKINHKGWSRVIWSKLSQLEPQTLSFQVSIIWSDLSIAGWMYLCQCSLSPEIGLDSISKLLGRIVDVLILVIPEFFFNSFPEIWSFTGWLKELDYFLVCLKKTLDSLSPKIAIPRPPTCVNKPTIHLFLLHFLLLVKTVEGFLSVLSLCGHFRFTVAKSSRSPAERGSHGTICKLWSDTHHQKHHLLPSYGQLTRVRHLSFVIQKTSAFSYPAITYRPLWLARSRPESKRMQKYGSHIGILEESKYRTRY